MSHNSASCMYVNLPEVVDEDRLKKYEALKQQVIKEAESYNIQYLKNHFIEEIESKRSLSKIKSLSELLLLLEERDCLNINDITSLKTLSKALENDSIMMHISNYESTVCLLNYCIICNEPISVSKEISHITSSQNPFSSCATKNKEIEDTICFLYQELGPRWIDLARALHIQDCDIDIIRAENPSNVKEQAYQALCLWKKQNGEKAVITDLISALQSPWCRRNDLAHKLKKGLNLGTNYGESSETLPSVFISYRRQSGSHLASLLKKYLNESGISVFLDVECLKGGKFNVQLLSTIKEVKNFILLLTPGALDRCKMDSDCSDWVHKELVTALKSNCNIILVFTEDFVWPQQTELPEDIREVFNFNAIRWLHEQQQACIKKLISWLK